jgi:hypothetical protein
METITVSYFPVKCRRRSIAQEEPGVSPGVSDEIRRAGVVRAVSRLVNKGYDREYRIKDDHLFDLALDSLLVAGAHPRRHRLRLESRPDPGDASNISIPFG